MAELENSESYLSNIVWYQHIVKLKRWYTIIMLRIPLLYTKQIGS